MKKMYPVFTMVVFCIVLLVRPGAGTGVQLWAEQKLPAVSFSRVDKAGGDYIDHGSGIALDSKDNIYVTGYFTSKAVFAKTSLTAPGEKNSDIFIAKYDKTGELKWVRRAGGTDFDEGTAVAVDSEDHVYVTGYFKAAAAFGQETLTSGGDRDVILAKFSDSGDLLWARQAGGRGEDNGYAVAAGMGIKDIFITGSFSDTAVFAGKQITAAGMSDIYIARYDPQGNVLWVQQAGGGSFDRGCDVAADTDDHVYVTGSFKGTARFGDISLTSYGDNDVFIAQYDGTGSLIWVKQAGGEYWDYGYGITVDNNNQVIVTGAIFDRARFDDLWITASANNHNDVFLAKYDDRGTLLWVRQAGGGSYDRGKAVAADNNGNIYIAGHFKTGTSFDGVTVTSFGEYDIFVARYGSDGTFTWLKQAGGPYYDEACALAVARDHGIYVVGDICGYDRSCIARFDTLSLLPREFDLFIAKIEASR